MKKLLVLLLIAAIGLLLWRRATLKEDARIVQAKVVEGATRAQEKVTGNKATMEAVADLAEDAADEAALAADAATGAAEDAAEAAGAAEAAAS